MCDAQKQGRMHMWYRNTIGSNTVSFHLILDLPSRTEGDKLTVLFIHDQFTNLMGAIPTPQKGGLSP